MRLYFNRRYSGSWYNQYTAALAGMSFKRLKEHVCHWPMRTIDMAKLRSYGVYQRPPSARLDGTKTAYIRDHTRFTVTVSVMQRIYSKRDKKRDDTWFYYRQSFISKSSLQRPSFPDTRRHSISSPFNRATLAARRCDSFLSGICRRIRVGRADGRRGGNAFGGS